MAWPDTLSINAWTGEGPATGAVDPRALDWALKRPPREPTDTLAPTEKNPREWANPDIGWGLILPERDGLSPAELASGADAPAPIRRLLKERNNAPVYRYRPLSKHRTNYLHDYREGAPKGGYPVYVDPRSPRGTALGHLPRYLLIYAPPTEIPWSLQYILNGTSAVGRLDLEGEALERYVDHLISGWQGSKSRVDRALIASVIDNDRITPLMRDAVANRLFEALEQDDDLNGKVTFLDGREENPTHERLIAKLKAVGPGLVVTTSHGMTGPVGDTDLMREQMGLLVDGEHQVLDVATLLAAWQPDGAIWYAHACCSAGADDQSIFAGLLKKGSSIDTLLRAIAKAGPIVSPLPRALLGAEKPLRAFVGHVEPTFDWTLYQPLTGQHLTGPVVDVFYDGIYGGTGRGEKRPDPIGLAMETWYRALQSLSVKYTQACTSFGTSDDPVYEEDMLYCRLSELDIQSMVILGDPTVVLPNLP